MADLAALNDLRDSYVEGQAYRITNPVVVTAVIGKFGSGQNTTNVWVQDQGCETTLGHSMMLYRIEENASNLQVGSVINNLIGQLTVYNDLVEMQYIDEASMEITGETADVVVTTVTIAELLGENAQSYQNALVRIDNVLFADGDGASIRVDLMNKCRLHTVLRLPTGIFYAQGVKTNVLFFSRATTDKGATDEVWFYDLRTNMPSFGKTNPLTQEHFAGFEAAYDAEDRHAVQDERWRAYSRAS